MSDQDKLLSVFQMAVHAFNTQQDGVIKPLLAPNATIYSIKQVKEAIGPDPVCSYLRINQFQNKKPIFTPSPQSDVSINGGNATISGIALWRDHDGDPNGNGNIKYVFAFQKFGDDWKITKLWGSAALTDNPLA